MSNRYLLCSLPIFKECSHFAIFLSPNFTYIHILSTSINYIYRYIVLFSQLFCMFENFYNTNRYLCINRYNNIMYTYIFLKDLK